MKKHKYLLVGLIFLVVGGLVVHFSKISTPMLSPVQISGAPMLYLTEALTEGNICIQEIPLTRDYLYGLEIHLFNFGRKNTNENVILVLNSSYQVLYREIFSSDEIIGFQYHPVKFKKNIYVGKGNKVYLCIYSPNGEQNNSIGLSFDKDGKLGDLYVSVINNDDIISSISNKARIYPGSLLLKSYESNYPDPVFFKRLLYFFILSLTLILIFFKKIKSFFYRANFQPERIFLLFSVPFGLLFLIITPPLQVPDEQFHLYRSYEISRFNFFKSAEKYPSSLIALDSTFQRLKFNEHQKTSLNEILSQTKIKLGPDINQSISTPDYNIPYLPQALGIFIGRFFDPSPLILLYLGRIFNLFCSVLILYFAIKVAPLFKWGFFLLALMPMTLSLMASLHYDGLTISFSFLLIALILKYAFVKQGKIELKEIAVLLIVAVLLALCKPRFFILILSFFLIPVQNFGSLKKYIAVFMLLVIAGLAAQQFKIFGLSISPSADNTRNINAASTTKLDSLRQVNEPPKRPGYNAPLKGSDATGQKQFILHNIPEYAGILFNSMFIYNRSLYVQSFVGVFGWLDTLLPRSLINLFLFTLFITALGSFTPGITLSWKNKIMLFILFLIGVIGTLTGQYLGWNPVGAKVIEGVQGRYFIPFAPLFFLLFYNKSIGEKLNSLFIPGKNKHHKLKSKVKSRPEIQPDPLLFNKLLNAFVILISFISLACSVFVMVIRFYWVPLFSQ